MIHRIDTINWIIHTFLIKFYSFSKANAMPSQYSLDGTSSCDINDDNGDNDNYTKKTGSSLTMHQE